MNPIRWYIEKVIDQREAVGALANQVALRAEGREHRMIVDGKTYGRVGTLYTDDWQPDPALVARLPRSLRRKVRAQ